MTLYDVMILIKSAINTNRNNHHYIIFLERGLYKESNTEYI